MTRAAKDVVADVLGLDPEEVDETTSRDTADNWDSLNHLRIITAIEQEFSLRLTMEEIQSVNSVQDLAEIMERQGQAS